MKRGLFWVLACLALVLTMAASSAPAKQAVPANNQEDACTWGASSVVVEQVDDALPPAGVVALHGAGACRVGRVTPYRRHALHLAEREAAGPVRPSAPSSVSVSGLIDYSGCPKRFYWTTVRPLPRFSGPAARIGTQVHAWIERQGSGQASLLELEESPDLTAEELTGEPGKVDRLQRSFLESRFGSAVPLFAERPFLLFLGGFVVNGRIDAIFGTPDGPWEVVDYKTGKRPGSDDPVAGLQLDLYALACTEVFGKRPEELRLTYFYLANGEEVSRGAGDPSETRARVLAALEGIGAGSFDPTPGDQCRWCDFLSFCSAGRAHVGKREANERGAR